MGAHGGLQGGLQRHAQPGRPLDTRKALPSTAAAAAAACRALEVSPPVFNSYFPDGAAVYWTTMIPWSPDLEIEIRGTFEKV